MREPIPTRSVPGHASHWYTGRERAGHIEHARLARNLGLGDETCACGMKRPLHIEWRAEIKRVLCCACYVREGKPPADWHPLCMATYESLLPQNDSPC